jgi:putative hemolysin
MKSLLVVFVMVLLVTGCSSAPATPPPAAMPNPASANCVEKGGKLDIRTEANGQVGYCKFPDGSECEEWAFFRNECQPKTPIVPATAIANMPNPASANCVKRGGDLVIRTDANGEAGYCQFPDGSECEEWALFRNECQPGAAAAPTITATVGVTVLVPLVSGSAATPQPKPIVFPAGSASTIEQGSVAANESVMYVVPALAGQTLSVNLTTVQGSAILQILGADGTVILPHQVGVMSWSGVLPAAQEYFIEVRSVTNIVTGYQLEVALPPL